MSRDERKDKPRLGPEAEELSFIRKTGDEPEGKPRKQGIQSKHEKARGPGGRPRIHTHKISKASQEGLPAGWSRATLILRESHIEELKALAWQDRANLKDFMDRLLEEALRKRKDRAEALKGYRSSQTIKIKGGR